MTALHTHGPFVFEKKNIAIAAGTDLSGEFADPNAPHLIGSADIPLDWGACAWSLLLELNRSPTTNEYGFTLSIGPLGPSATANVPQRVLVPTDGHLWNSNGAAEALIEFVSVDTGQPRPDTVQIGAWISNAGTTETDTVVVEARAALTLLV